MFCAISDNWIAFLEEYNEEKVYSFISSALRESIE